MKGFVEFGHETSYTIHFLGLFCYKALTLTVEKACSKR